MAVAQLNPPSVVLEPKKYLTIAEYHAIEETAEERHQYQNGEIIAMSGGSPAHSRVAVDITTLLNVAVRSTNFQVYNGDMRIWIPSFNHGTYADVLVINGEPEFHGDRTDEILNPVLIVEVLSPSTEAYDRGEKFRKYRSLSSFCEYLLVSQLEPYVEQYHLIEQKIEQRDRWQLQICDRLDQTVSLQSLNIEIPMQEIYRRIKF
jgi:Uma2 family endonuclease